MGTPTAGLEGVIAGESEICYIDGSAGVLSYRGYNIHTLADHANFEETIFLLWNGWLPKQGELDQLKKELAAERELPAAVVDFLKSVPQSNTMDVLRTAVSMLGLYDPAAQDMSAEANHRKAVRRMSRTSAIVTTYDRLRNGKAAIDPDPNLSFAANFLYTLTGTVPDEIMERAFDVAMTLDRKSTRLNSSHANIYTLSLHDALPIYRSGPEPELRGELSVHPDGHGSRRDHGTRFRCGDDAGSEEHTSELQSRQYLHSFPTRRSSDLSIRTRT